MFKGIGALPQRAKMGWVITQTLLAQFVLILTLFALVIIMDGAELCNFI